MDNYQNTTGPRIGEPKSLTFTWTGLTMVIIITWQWKQKMLNYMNKDLTLNFKDALFLLNVHFPIGPKK